MVREHDDAVGPVLEWHPGGGIRCTDLLLGVWRAGQMVMAAAAGDFRTRSWLVSAFKLLRSG
ncbi:hypothetical protein OG373_41055 [Streptomyces avidinii]|uniref:hypothetical protein n=1 Tax=Streptomyces avidinii TaxID=1895 RepID=UPI00386A3BD9|nr:hypothetical protein OG373_00115 [Streptomyces avidinii]WTB02244.1 hypothetical protein OG373_41055 [Streptomyces avidinii]